MSNEQSFREWLSTHPEKLGDHSIDDYVNVLQSPSTVFGVDGEPFFELSSLDKVQRTLRVIRSTKKIDDVDAQWNGLFSSAIRLYQRYLCTQLDFRWVAFYSELADILLTYKNRRQELIDIIVKVFAELDIKLPTLEETEHPIDIDPFTVFGLFNKGISTYNRIRIIQDFANAFGVKSAVPRDFQGIPVLDNRKATFYAFSSNRSDRDIDNLWDFFEFALSYSADQSIDNKKSFIEAFDIVTKQYGIRWNITMGLFWIRPNTYLNLDSRNQWFIANPKNLTMAFANSLPKFNKVPSGAVYLDICENCTTAMNEMDLPYKNYPELSAFAWYASEEDNDYGKNGDVDDETADDVEVSTALGDQDVRTRHYWLYAPGEKACKWDEFNKAGIIAIGWPEIGDLSQFETRKDIIDKMINIFGENRKYFNDSAATWQFSHEMEPGDIVFAKRGKDTIVGRGVVKGLYQYDPNISEDYPNRRNIEWTNEGEWKYPMGHMPLKTLTDITTNTGNVEKLNALFECEENAEEESIVHYDAYNREKFLSEVYMNPNDYDKLVSILKRKKNVILQGAPGVGKSFAAKRLAYSIIGEKNPERIQMVQFHQSYSYEDFIQGFRPDEDGRFRKIDGVFYKFCKKAAEEPENDYFFIIDEINRGNLSKIFGELFLLMEADKRDEKLQLLYANEQFWIPKNVYIIGMMNTADRSLAMLDFALRRRFAFFEMKPGFDTDGFTKYQNALENEKFNHLVFCIKQLNAQIAEDSSLGNGFCIGHSYLCGLSKSTLSDSELNAIVEYELIPLLKEYWFDEPVKVEDWTTKLRKAIQ